MKKLLFIAMIIASVGAKAQTPTLCNGIIPILMGDSVIFDLPEHPFDITYHPKLSTPFDNDPLEKLKRNIIACPVTNYLTIIKNN